MSAMTRQDADALLKKHGTKAAAARAAGIPVSTFRDRLRSIAAAEARKAIPAAEEPTGNTHGAALLSLDAVVKPFDIVGKALAIVTGLPDRKLMADSVLQRQIGIGEGRWRAARGSTRLAGYWYSLPDKSVAWGSKAAIVALGNRMREL